MAKIQKIKKTIFVHTIEIFDLQVLVCVGVNAKEIKTWADKNSKSLKQIFSIKEHYNNLEIAVNGAGAILHFVKDGCPYYILWLYEYQNNWDELDVLNHEIAHLRQVMFRDKRILEEWEFEAHFHKAVFRTIRQALHKKLK